MRDPDAGLFRGGARRLLENYMPGGRCGGGGRDLQWRGRRLGSRRCGVLWRPRGRGRGGS